jgi:hypothetical protein
MIQGDRKLPNPWSYDIFEGRSFNGSWQIGNDYGSTRTSGTLTSTPLTLPDWNRAEVYNKALDRLIDKARGSLDLGTSIAEAGQTAKMLRKAGGLLNFVRSIPKLGPLFSKLNRLVKDPRAHNLETEIALLLKQIADLYLEYQFG